MNMWLDTDHASLACNLSLHPKLTKTKFISDQRKLFKPSRTACLLQIHSCPVTLCFGQVPNLSPQLGGVPIRRASAKVGFESVSGFGFRVSSLETGFGFRVSVEAGQPQVAARGRVLSDLSFSILSSLNFFHLIPFWLEAEVRVGRDFL